MGVLPVHISGFWGCPSRMCWGDVASRSGDDERRPAGALHLF
jgi:hypothetical protein